MRKGDKIKEEGKGAGGMEEELEERNESFMKKETCQLCLSISVDCYYPTTIY